MESNVKPRLTVGTLLLLLAVAALVSFWYAKNTWIQPGNAVSPMQDSEFSESGTFYMPPSDRPLVYEQLSVERFLTLLGQYVKPPSVTWEVETTVFSSGGSRTRMGRLILQDSDYELTIWEGGRQTRTVTLFDDIVTVNDNLSLPYSAVYSPMGQLGMADIDYLLAVNPASITEAGWAELDFRQVLYVRLEDPDLPLIEYYWVSVELGLPLRCETYEGDTLTYLARTISVEASDTAATLD